jgi:hypothetical protein
MNIKDLHQAKSKIWFIQVDGLKEGPYSLVELKNHPKMTPDILVMKQGSDQWIRARFIPELQSIFEDEKEPEDKKDPSWISVPADDTAVLMENSSFPFFFYWILIILLVLAYVYYRLFWQE